MPIAIQWRVYANVELGRPRIVVSKSPSEGVRVYDATTWKRIREQESEFSNADQNEKSQAPSFVG